MTVNESYRLALSAWYTWAVNIGDCETTAALLLRGEEISETDWLVWSAFARFGDYEC